MRASAVTHGNQHDLLRIPVEQADFDAGACELFLEHCKIGAVVVIGNHDLGVEGFDRVGRFFGRHGVGEIHADEGDVDVLEGAHFGNVFGVAGEIEADAAEGEDVSVAAAFVVEKFAGRRATGEVVGGNGFDGPALPGFGFAIGDGLGRVDGGDDGGGGQNFGPGLGDFGDGSGIHVVEVNVGNEDEIGFGKTRELGGFGGVEVDGLSAGFDQGAGVIERSDLDVSSFGPEDLRSGGGVGQGRHHGDGTGKKQK